MSQLLHPAACDYSVVNVGGVNPTTLQDYHRALGIFLL